MDPSRLGRALRGWLLRRRRSADARLIEASGLFDRAFYLAQNPDVAAAGVDPLAHYLDYGGAEGRDPGPRFDTRAYLAAYPEAPLLHALRSGNAARPLAPLRAAADRPEAARALARWRDEVVALPRRALVVDDRLPTPELDASGHEIVI